MVYNTLHRLILNTATPTITINTIRKLKLFSCSVELGHILCFWWDGPEAWYIFRRPHPQAFITSIL